MSRSILFVAGGSVFAALVALILVVAISRPHRPTRLLPNVAQPTAENEAPADAAAKESATSKLPSVPRPRAPRSRTPPQPSGSLETTEALIPIRMESTAASSLFSDLRCIRSQLQLYAAQHEGRFPTHFELQMTRYTDIAGNTSDAYSNQFRFGPYMMAVPVNPATGVATVTQTDDPQEAYAPAADMSRGWWYNSATGEFRCHTPNPVLTQRDTPVNSL